MDRSRTIASSASVSLRFGRQGARPRPSVTDCQESRIFDLAHDPLSDAVACLKSSCRLVAQVDGDNLFACEDGVRATLQQRERAVPFGVLL
jgi:hypothetical protein